MAVLSFGEIIWDVYPDKACIGGAPLNFAAHLVREGTDAVLLSAVGHDALGEKALRRCTAFGIDDSLIQENPYPTGQCTVTLDADGMPRYTIEPDAAYDFLIPPVLPSGGFDAIAFGSLSLRGAQNRETLRQLLETGHFKEQFCDINIRPPFYTEETVRFCFANATIVKISREELPTVTSLLCGERFPTVEAAVRALSDRFPQVRLFVLTLDKDGGGVFDVRTGTWLTCPAKKVKVVSTVGAGDSFGAAFLAHYLRGDTTENCLRAAITRSAFVVSQAEAIPDEPLITGADRHLKESYTMKLHPNRIVIKVGTSTLTNEQGKSNLRSFEKLALTIADIQNLGYEVVLVSSGAIAVGANKMHLDARPTSMRMKQAAAAVGQCSNMFLYDKFFGYYDKTIGQILLNAEDITQEEKKENLSNTFNALLENGVIPIVNENDSVSYTEIESEEKLFGDNDMLSAVVAVLCQAGRLVIFSDIDGFYDKDPRLHTDAKLIRRIDTIDDSVYALAGGAGSRRGTGGMKTKLQAAALATAQGIDTIVTNGNRPEALYDIVNGNEAGTLFVGAHHV